MLREETNPLPDRTIAEQIAANYRQVQSQVHQACREAGRVPSDVKVIGVSKYVDAAMTQLLVDAGCSDLGENRPQVLWQKAESLRLPSEFRWHMIGHVQTNKLRRLLRFRPLIHSIDSERLLRAIDAEASQQETIAEGLVEINVSGEDAKTGIDPDEARRLFETLNRDGDQLHSVRIGGLMAMAGWKTTPEEAGKQFRMLATLRDELEQTYSLALPELSMGMTSDFREAIAAGATMVRIGSALFPPEIRKPH
ncbi:MAG: YggS family pyridoxal phosphate-dependent enzyme [Planctomycetota bacterium]